MKTMRNVFLATMTAAAFGVAGAVAAGGAPKLMTDAEMDLVVAGAIFEDEVVTVVVSTEWYHGYSNNLADGPGNGRSSAEVTTTTTTTRVLDCPGGAKPSCYTSEPNLNPNTEVLSSSSTVETSKVLTSGPGNSFDNRSF